MFRDELTDYGEEHEKSRSNLKTDSINTTHRSNTTVTYKREARKGETFTRRLNFTGNVIYRTLAIEGQQELGNSAG